MVAATPPPCGRQNGAFPPRRQVQVQVQVQTSGPDRSAHPSAARERTCVTRWDLRTGVASRTSDSSARPALVALDWSAPLFPVLSRIRGARSEQALCSSSSVCVDRGLHPTHHHGAASIVASVVSRSNCSCRQGARALARLVRGGCERSPRRHERSRSRRALDGRPRSRG